MNEPSQALEVIQPQTEMPLAVPEASKPAITAAQGKIEAIANLTMSAYQRAATLDITPEESAKLQADFPDEAFQPGAAGKENLIYIEHAHLRDRFNDVFGMGKWAIVPRNRWAESFTTHKGTPGERVYVEAMLVVRGCFVGEAVGAMEYYPKNESQNYGDAVEGAKTAAFRRCAKEFGVGLQAWKKDWCAEWWKRRRVPPAPKTVPTTTTTPPPKQNAPTVNVATPAAPKTATKVTLQAMMEFLMANGVSEQDILGYGIDKAIIMPNEGLIDWPLDKVGLTRTAWNELLAAIKKSTDGDLGPAKEPGINSINAEWRTFPMPFGKKAGVMLENLEKNYLYGLWRNYKVETEYNGKPKRAETIAKDTKFREMLDAAGEHYEFTKP